MKMELSGKHILVTGAAEGIGACCVRDLLQNGVAKCAILDLNKASGEETTKRLSAEFGQGRVKFVRCDVTDTKEFEEAVNIVMSDFKTLDIFINNAGILNEDIWEKEIQINYKALVHGTFLASRIMSVEKGGRGGTVVNLSSIAGLGAIGICPVYAGTKHAVIGFTTSMAAPYHFNRSGVRMLVLCPGVTNTRLLKEAGERQQGEDITEWKREIEVHHSQSAEHVSHAIVHIIKTAENGSVWMVDGGKPVVRVDKSGTDPSTMDGTH